VSVLAVSPVTDEVAAYAKKVHAALVEAGLRSEIDLSEDNISAKIKARELQKVPYMAVVGAKELAAGAVAVREHKKGNRGVIPFVDFVSNLRRDVAAKTTV
jgi:threonyl-tRNA synthetase